MGLKLQCNENLSILAEFFEDPWVAGYIAGFTAVFIVGEDDAYDLRDESFRIFITKVGEPYSDILSEVFDKETAKQIIDGDMHLSPNWEDGFTKGWGNAGTLVKYGGMSPTLRDYIVDKPAEVRTPRDALASAETGEQSGTQDKRLFQTLRNVFGSTGSQNNNEPENINLFNREHWSLDLMAAGSAEQHIRLHNSRWGQSLALVFSNDMLVFLQFYDVKAFFGYEIHELVLTVDDVQRYWSFDASGQGTSLIFELGKLNQLDEEFYDLMNAMDKGTWLKAATEINGENSFQLAGFKDVHQALLDRSGNA